MDNRIVTLLVIVSVIGSLLADELTDEEKINAVITVTSPPRITRNPPLETPYKKEEEVTLYCIATGQPAPSYTWLVDGVELEITGDNIKQVANEGTIIIQEPGPEHEGTYQCLAENEFGTALSTKAIVKMAKLDPFKTKDIVPIHRPRVGTYLKLVCDPPESYPNGEIYWGEGNKDEKVNAIENDNRVILDYEGSLHFANVQPSDELKGARTGTDSNYVCIVQNGLLRSLVQGDDQQVKPEALSVTPPHRTPEIRWHSESPKTVLEGQRVKMKCIFSGYPTPRVTWERQGGLALPAGHEINDHGLELAIPEVKFEDDGSYACKAANTRSGDPVIQVLVVNVQAKPKWRTKPDSIDTSEEETAVFHCEARGLPEPDITWSRNGVNLENIEGDRFIISDNGKTVTYPNVTKTDAAVLQCNATNVHGYIFTNAYLNVLSEPPTFITPPQAVVKVAEGQKAVLACEVFGAPKPVVTWRKDGEVVEGNRFAIDTKGKIAGNLTIEPAILSDAGMYECRAVNKFGELPGSGELIVRNKTEIVSPPLTQDVRVGDDVVLNCDATTDAAEMSKLKITWKKNGEPINFEEEPTLSFDTEDNSLRISGATVTDTGSFTCVASNGLDSDEFTAEITVKDRPGPPWDLGVIECGSLAAELEWDPAEANNDPIIEYIVYYRTEFDGPDEYHEGAKVDAGTTKATVTLSPWADFTFYAVARNSIGTSDRSGVTNVCTTPPDKPYRNPENVCTSSIEPDELVITWTKMPQEEHHGEDFRYLVSYKPRDDPDANPTQVTIDDWQQEELVVPNQPTFQQYEISVQAVNREGPSSGRSLETRLGYSGEDVPAVSPTGFELKEDTLTAKTADFSWDKVEDDPDIIRGHFKGYQIVYWKEGESENKRTTDIILNYFDPCPLLTPAASGRKRRQAEEKQTGHVLDLWPFSTINAGVLVLNGAKSGALSDVITFSTPEGLPGAVQNGKVTQRGTYHFKLQWDPPLEANGIIIGYSVGYKELHKLLEDPVFPDPMLPPHTRETKVKQLEPETDYALYIYAHTNAGRGDDHVLLEGSTRVLMPPDKPSVDDIIYGDNSAEVSWEESEKDEQDQNPGSEFYVKYRIKGNDTWVIAKPEDDNDNFVNITGLEDGTEYEIVVVAVSGNTEPKQETESDPKIFLAGEPKKEKKEDIGIATAGWFISLMCLLILLLLILLIVCLVRRNRGGKYPVHEKEKLRGRPDDPEDRMGEYNKQPYMPLETKSDEPDYMNQKPPIGGSIDKEDQPLAGSESDSLAEYEDTDPTKFNEDGSFIGAYAGDSGYKKADTTSPLSTFV